MDSLRVEHRCPSCKMRFRLGPPTQHEYQVIPLPRGAIGYLLAAAREFDETAERMTPGECFTAVDFVDWIRPSLRGTPPLRLHSSSKKVAVSAAGRRGA